MCFQAPACSLAWHNSGSVITAVHSQWLCSCEDGQTLGISFSLILQSECWKWLGAANSSTWFLPTWFLLHVQRPFTNQLSFYLLFSYKNLRNSLRIKCDCFCSPQWFSTTLYRLQIKRSSSLGEITGQIKMISLEHLCLQDLVVGPPGLSAPCIWRNDAWYFCPFAMQVVPILPPRVYVA